MNSREPESCTQNVWQASFLSVIFLQSCLLCLCPNFLSNYLNCGLLFVSQAMSKCFVEMEQGIHKSHPTRAEGSTSASVSTDAEMSPAPQTPITKNPTPLPPLSVGLVNRAGGQNWCSEPWKTPTEAPESTYHTGRQA